MKLALFDLDHTLIPFDSGMAWTRFLVARGVLPADAETVYLGYCQQYVDGTLDIRELHRVSVAPLASFGMPRSRRRCPGRCARWCGGTRTRAMSAPS
jgi:phosphoserine phosphatase